MSESDLIPVRPKSNSVSRWLRKLDPLDADVARETLRATQSQPSTLRHSELRRALSGAGVVIPTSEELFGA